jgi:hypothetical protein
MWVSRKERKGKTQRAQRFMCVSRKERKGKTQRAQRFISPRATPAYARRFGGQADPKGGKRSGTLHSA